MPGTKPPTIRWSAPDALELLLTQISDSLTAIVNQLQELSTISSELENLRWQGVIVNFPEFDQPHPNIVVKVIGGNDGDPAER